MHDAMRTTITAAAEALAARHRNEPWFSRVALGGGTLHLVTRGPAPFHAHRPVLEYPVTIEEESGVPRSQPSYATRRARAAAGRCPECERHVTVRRDGVFSCRHRRPVCAWFRGLDQRARERAFR